MTYSYDMHAGKYVGEHRGVKYTLPTDDHALDPREESDTHLGIMACEHRRYKLGDKDGTSALTDAIRASRFYRPNWENDGSEWGNTRYSKAYKGDASEPAGISAILSFCKDIIYLPLYLYDHSGITMSTGSFADKWDSGQVGFIFTTMDQIVNAFPDWFAAHKRPILRPERRQQIIGYLRGEVTEYDYYLTGQVYLFKVGDETMGSYNGDQSASEAAEEYIDGLSEDERAALIAAQDDGDQEEADD